MFAKIFEQILDSSIAEDPHLRHFFMDCLLLCDAEGILDMTPSAIAARTRLPLDDVRRWLARLEQPDGQSRTPDLDGRRLVRLDEHRDWGWRVVNYVRFRESATRHMLRMGEADRKREYRRRHGQRQALPQSPSPKEEADTEGEADKSRTCPGLVPDKPCAPGQPREAKSGTEEARPLSNAERVSLDKELDRIKEQKEAIRGKATCYAFGSQLDPVDAIHMQELKARERQILARLGAVA